MRGIICYGLNLAAVVRFAAFLIGAQSLRDNSPATGQAAPISRDQLDAVANAPGHGGANCRRSFATAAWQEAELTKRAKGDVGKVKLAGRLRTETVLTVKWIAERWQVGTAVYGNSRMYRWRNGTLPRKGRKEPSKGSRIVLQGWVDSSAWSGWSGGLDSFC